MYTDIETDKRRKCEELTKETDYLPRTENIHIMDRSGNQGNIHQKEQFVPKPKISASGID